MMKKTYRLGSPGREKLINVRLDPVVNEVPGTLRVMKKEIQRLEDTVKRQQDEITALRQLLINQSNIEYWEVPG